MKHVFELAAASPNDGLDVLAMLNEIGPGENGFINHAHDLQQEAWPAYLASLSEQSVGLELAPSRVQNTVYWLRRDGYPVAMSKLRHTLNDELLTIGASSQRELSDAHLKGVGFGMELMEKPEQNVEHSCSES